MTKSMENILGPRVPREELRNRTVRYVLPTALLVLAGALLGGSYTQCYWKMTLHAPQYPKGLHVQAYLNRLEGDVHEIDGLNHYIGMRPLNDAAQLERQTSAMMVAVVAGLLLAAVFIHSRWAALAALPGLLFPIGFLADLQYWLASFGTNLDPHAALSSSIKPFVPPVLGVGMIGQFKTVAAPGAGWWLAVAASLVIVVALYFHRRAYKPLFDRRRTRGPSAAPASSAAAAIVLLLGGAATGRAGDVEWRDLNEQIARAAAGTTVIVPPGTYAAPVIVDKPLILVADGDVTIDAAGVGDAVRITAPDVTLRGFRIRDTGASLDRQNSGIVVSAPRAIVEDNTLEDVLLGVLLNGSPQSVVRRNRIRGKDLDLSRRGDGIRLWSSNSARVECNEVEAVRDVVIWYSADVQLVGNTVRGSRYGMHFMYASGGVLEGNQLCDNSVGVFLMYSHDVILRQNVFERNRGPSGYGVGLKDMDGVTAEGNKIVGNRVGVYVDNSPSGADRTQEFRRNIFAFNDVALAFLPAVQRNRFVENEFHENLEQVAILGGGELKNNAFTVDGRGNFWSDYSGFDADGDGLGDMPYRATSLFENLIDREPKVRLFLHSPAQQAIELASRAFPVMRPQAKITDEAPLMSPNAVAPPPQAAAAWSVPKLGIAILALPFAAARALRRRRAERDPRDVSAVRTADAGSHRSRSDSTIGPVVEIRDLTKRFGRQTAVDKLSLAVAPGEALALWGTNGAGKTTVIKCILGLHRYQGSIRVLGVDARRRGRDARRLLGYVSQELSFYDDWSVIETTRLFAALKRVPGGRASEVLGQVRLGEHAHKRVCELSGGMKQRLALAVALLADPPVLLLDEPTSNLDAGGRRAFFDLLRSLKSARKTILFTTHRADEVTGLADRVITLERGRVVRADAPDRLTTSHRLRIVVADQQRGPALDLLRSAGFDVRHNCTALLVRVQATRNAAPITHLARAGVDVEMLEIDSGDQP
ncbi:MAG: nitrous oxide reductase family maturation protein NosD [Phycisphaerae bacterium]